MNQMPQDDPEIKHPTETKHSPEAPDPPPAHAHPRFTKPQRVAFVQSAWHRDVIEQCRLAFLTEIEQRGIERAHRSLRGGGFTRDPAAHPPDRPDAALHRAR